MSQDKQVVPFFATYLENQAEDMSTEELNEVSGGAATFEDDDSFKEEKPKNLFDIKIDFPAFPNTFPFNKSVDDGFGSVLNNQ
jgi:Serine endopeptidase inhibitors